MNDWISVEDRLPPYGTYVFLACLASDGERRWTTEGHRESTDRFGEHYMHAGGQNINRSEVTHWMPLPEPPK